MLYTVSNLLEKPKQKLKHHRRAVMKTNIKMIEENYRDNVIVNLYVRGNLTDAQEQYIGKIKFTYYRADDFAGGDYRKATLQIEGDANNPYNETAEQMKKNKLMLAEIKSW
jgi:hypothetical protein